MAADAAARGAGAEGALAYRDPGRAGRAAVERINETKVALAVLVDTSASVSPADLERASQLAEAINEQKGRHWMRVIPFARSTRHSTLTKAKPASFSPPRAKPDAPPIWKRPFAKRWLRLPAGMVPRVALISDGKENKGSIARAAWQAQQLGIPIDTFALKGRPKPALRLESIQPAIARLHGRTISHRR